MLPYFSKNEIRGSLGCPMLPYFSKNEIKGSLECPMLPYFSKKEINGALLHPNLFLNEVHGPSFGGKGKCIVSSLQPFYQSK